MAIFKVSNMEDYQIKLLDLAMKCKALKFGSFTLKSGRQSPYFFNMGLINDGEDLISIANAFAHAIIKTKLDFDVLFGPAYKGIPLAAITLLKLAELKPETYGKCTYAFNRKEKKDHGEGGTIVGGLIEGKKVLILDDVMTAGTAIKEALGIVEGAKGNVVGCMTALDRQETTVDSEFSANQVIQKTFHLPVYSIISLANIIDYLKDKLSEEDIKAIENYRVEYSPKK